MEFASNISKFNRERKWRKFIDTFSFTQDTTLLDVGFNNKEYSTNDNYLEKYYPYPSKITALGIISQGKDIFQANYPEVNAVLYDGKTFPFEDKQFDVCWSNAVLEHVGDYSDQLYFLKEMKRVSSALFFTTPNKNFPIEVHTRTPLLHLFSKRMFEKYLIIIGKKWATGDYMNLLSYKQIKKLLEDADIKHYKIFRNKIFCFTLDFVVVTY